MEEVIVEIKVLLLRKAILINHPFAGREFLIDEIILGMGSHRKAIKYTNGLLKYGAECRAQVISPGKVRII